MSSALLPVLYLLRSMRSIDIDSIDPLLLSEARHLGAKIVKVRRAGRSLYRLSNWVEISALVLVWIEREESRVDDIHLVSIDY